MLRVIKRSDQLRGELRYGRRRRGGPRPTWCGWPAASAGRPGRATLAGSTLYTSTEPCSMCAGAIYWSGIGRMVFALSEVELAGMVAEEEGVPPLRLPSRDVFTRGGRPIVVDGPVALPSARAVYEGFWPERRSSKAFERCATRSTRRQPERPPFGPASWSPQSLAMWGMRSSTPDPAR
jgi:hypothetical protein